MIDHTLLFVDGENLTLRYQEMLSEGRTPAPDNIVIKDCFVWNPRILDDMLWNIRRFSHYTSVVGDDAHVRSVRQQISTVTFSCRTSIVSQGLGHTFMTRSGQIVPFVRKKLLKARKESICDIAIAVDIMRACYRDNADTIWLFSGDGDFIQLLSEAVHSGKCVYASAFSSGMNEDLRYAVDEFFLLDKYFFVDPLAPPAAAAAPSSIEPTSTTGGDLAGQPQPSSSANSSTGI